MRRLHCFSYSLALVSPTPTVSGLAKAGSSRSPPLPHLGSGRGQSLSETPVFSLGARCLSCAPSPPNDPPFLQSSKPYSINWKNLNCLPTVFGVASLSSSQFETTSHEGKPSSILLPPPTLPISGTLRFPGTSTQGSSGPSHSPGKLPPTSLGTLRKSMLDYLRSQRRWPLTPI